jgi:hypothetical protein
MNHRFVVSPALGILAAAAIALGACTTTSGTMDVAAVETPDGAIVVETMTTTATVTAIDPVKRKLTLVSPGGSKTTYKAGAETVNFAQMQVGDQVRATVTEEVAIYLGSGAPPSASGAGGVALAAYGSKPGGVLVDTARLTVTVTGVDAAKHRVTIRLPDGTSKTVKVGKKVDLAAVRPGDNVTVQVTEGLAITVEKP